MPLAKRTIAKYNQFNLPLSYKINDTDNNIRDCANFYSGQDRLIKRNGSSRYNSVWLGDKAYSLSYFKKSDDTKKVLVKAGTVLKDVSTTSAHTDLKTGLVESTKHRGLTMRDTHLIALGSDGLFQYNGTTFTQLGQDAPSAPTVTASAGGSLADTSEYTIKLTFYSSTTGFETNGGTASTTLTIAATDQTIDVTDIPTSAANDTIDEVWVYMKKDTGSYLFVESLALGVSLTSIAADTDSTIVPPTTNAAPRAGGGKFLTTFNDRLVVAGNANFLNDIFFSEQNLPDAFDDGSTGLVLFAEGNGPVTGIATGFYSDGNMEPYLVIFKRSSTEVYSERDGFSRKVMIDPKIGCVSHDTIELKDGNIFFLSEKGWRVITDGRMIKDSKNNAITLGGGLIDDIFSSPGYEYEINRGQFSNTHSVYYPTLDQYITWVSEGSSAEFTKAYIYEFSSSNGFKVYTFELSATCSVVIEDSEGDPVVLYGNDNGYLHQHSTKENKNDVDTNGGPVSMQCFALINWIDGDDYDATFNFRELIVRGVAEISDIEVRAAVNRLTNQYNSNTMSFPYGGTDGFILDVSLLDVGTFGEDRVLTTSRTDINRTGRDLSIGFYQNELNADVQLASYQINFNKNGNNNI